MLRGEVVGGLRSIIRRRNPQDAARRDCQQDLSNAALNRLQVVPLTSNAGRLYPSEAAVTIDGKPGKAMAAQLTTAAKERLKNKIGSLSREDMRAVEKALKIQLGMRL